MRRMTLHTDRARDCVLESAGLENVSEEAISLDMRQVQPI